MPPFQVVFAVGTQGARPPIPEHPGFPNAVIELIRDCWHEEPLSRPSFGEIVQRFEALE